MFEEFEPKTVHDLKSGDNVLVGEKWLYIYLRQGKPNTP